MYNSQETIFRIKQRAKEQGIAILDLQTKCDLGRNAISQAAKSQDGMKARNLFAIAEVLDCSVDYLLGKTVNENKPSPAPVQNESRFGPETQKVINDLLAKLRAMPDKKQEEAARGALTYVRGVVSAEDQEGKA